MVELPNVKLVPAGGGAEAATDVTVGNNAGVASLLGVAPKENRLDALNAVVFSTAALATGAKVELDVCAGAEVATEIGPLTPSGAAGLI